MTTYELLRDHITRLRDAGLIPVRPTREQAIDWAYGNTVLSNPNITREMVERAYDELRASGELRNVGEQ